MCCLLIAKLLYIINKKLLEGTACYESLLQSPSIQSLGFHLKGHITWFQFMATKQFSIEKLGTLVCADISKYPFENRYIQFVKEKITFFRGENLVVL